MTEDNALMQLSRAQLALSECKTVMDAKQIADAAQVARVYLQRLHASKETVNRAKEIEILAEYKMGEFLEGMPKNEGKLRKGPVVVEDDHGETPKTLAQLELTKDQSARAQKLRKIPEEELHERIALAQASGGKLSTAKVLNPEPAKSPFPAAAAAAGDEAAEDSETLWRLKSLWKKTNKKDREKFTKWIQN